MARYIGLMSGTSIDGVDAVLVEFPEPTRSSETRANSEGSPARRTLVSGERLDTLARTSVDMPLPLRTELLALQRSGPNEIERAWVAGNLLADLYAQAVSRLLEQAGVVPAQIRALGAHGQTVRHQPQAGYTVQVLNGARLAESTGIDVICDLRSADVAAGGQGAPLVPAFHAQVFADPDIPRAIVNIGGIANVSLLRAGQPVIGFDTGPGNVLMDLWIHSSQGLAFDQDGGWAAAGTVDQALLQSMLQEPYFALPAPKSTGRDLFEPQWLARQLAGFRDVAEVDVQATLTELTAHTIARACREAEVREVYVCGGGANNGHLLRRLGSLLPGVPVATTSVLGMHPQAVEATAFAWLAHRRLAVEPGNLPSVTGAAGSRVLGAHHVAGPAPGGNSGEAVKNR